MIPVRCFSCNKVIAGKYQTYKKEVEEGIKPKTSLDSLGIKRICCRRMFLGHVEVVDQLLPFSDIKVEIQGKKKKETV